MQRQRVSEAGKAEADVKAEIDVAAEAESNGKAETNVATEAESNGKAETNMVTETTLEIERKVARYAANGSQNYGRCRIFEMRK